MLDINVFIVYFTNQYIFATICYRYKYFFYLQALSHGHRPLYCSILKNYISKLCQYTIIYVNFFFVLEIDKFMIYNILFISNNDSTLNIGSFKIKLFSFYFV